jgi:glycine/D-amino acid oxidase-like deaminating enzyme
MSNSLKKPQSPKNSDTDQDVEAYDYVIVGGGLAGLCAALRILDFTPSARVILLEANEYFGGRTRVESWNGHKLHTGARYGRLDRDKRLLSLLRRLDVPVKIFPNRIKHLLPGGPAADVLGSLKSMMGAFAVGSSMYRTLTFGQMARRFMHPKSYQAFKDAVGCTDFEPWEAYEGLYHYDFRQKVQGRRYRFDWNLAVSRLADEVRGKGATLLNNTSAAEVRRDRVVTVSDGKKYRAERQVVLAIPVPNLRSVLSSDLKTHLGAFLRCTRTTSIALVYAVIDVRRSGGFVEQVGSDPGTTVVVKPPLQKISPVDPASGLYLLAHADSASADEIKQNAESVRWIEDQVREATGHPVRILDSKIYYWKHGAHYFAPGTPRFNSRKRYENVMTRDGGVVCIGEAFTSHHGWAEGAVSFRLPSIRRVI